MTLQFDEFLKVRYPFHRRFLFAPLESPKFALHSYQTLDTYTILSGLIVIAFFFSEKSVTTCLLCKNLVGSSIDTIESTLEGFIVGIIDGAVNGFFEQSNVNILIYNRNTFFNNLGILIGWKLLELDLCELLCWSLWVPLTKLLRICR